MLSHRKPFLSGTSNSRQGDIYGWIRGSNRPFHREDHGVNCCTAFKEADFLMIASIPGLGISNLSSKKVPRFSSDVNREHRGLTTSDNQRYGGLTLSGVVQKVSKDPEFNGHFCLWMLDNDGEFIHHNHSSTDLGMGEYIDMLSGVFEDTHIERLYLTTAPLRVSDFRDYNNPGCVSIAECKMKFNNRMRSVYGGGHGKINHIPVTLVDLNLCFPERDMGNSKFYCKREKDKVHFNARSYVKFLSLLHDLLESHSGLSIPSSNPTSQILTVASASAGVSASVSSHCSPVLPGVCASTTAETLNVTVVDDASSSTTSSDASITSSDASIISSAASSTSSDSSPSPAASKTSQVSPLPKENVPAKDKLSHKKFKTRGKHSNKRQLSFLFHMEPDCDT